mmetsp:Transcript_22812/g.58056  ORF Transcript_22812/g.58056 Transcript_22812/m.58056 type:complete len:332 (-) Transcript_22812:1979-2974(-)
MRCRVSSNTASWLTAGLNTWSKLYSRGFFSSFHACVTVSSSGRLSPNAWPLSVSKGRMGRTRQYTRILPFMSSMALNARLRATCSSRYSFSSSSRRLAWCSMMAACCFSLRSMSDLSSRSSSSSRSSCLACSTCSLASAYSALTPASSSRISPILSSLDLSCDRTSPCAASNLLRSSPVSVSLAFSIRCIFFSISSFSLVSCATRLSSCADLSVASASSRDLASSAAVSSPRRAPSATLTAAADDAATVAVAERASVSSDRAASTSLDMAASWSCSMLLASSSLVMASTTSLSSAASCSFWYLSSSTSRVMSSSFFCVSSSAFCSAATCAS